MGEVDFFRDTWVRYLGYANEVGESFRPLIPVKVVRASYAVAFAYGLADTADKKRWKTKKSIGGNWRCIHLANSCISYYTGLHHQQVFIFTGYVPYPKIC
ncbi:unnamed protein product [Leptidea sinapis]|uniref:Mitochondrial fission process protein 1 n=1 Tax=Leptidea sinapis TaxID=189913 RepID=A0A5E4QHR3_9NEOP|nr:unnamed protein product [Leptidea sinapis]